MHDHKYPKGANYFWQSFVLEQHHFDEILMSSKITRLLHNYFSNNRIVAENFEIKIAQEYPDKYIDAIKTNKVFFKSDRIDFLINKIQFPEQFNVHQTVWKIFYEREIQMWNQIADALEKIVKLSLTEVLQVTTYWIEENYFATDNRGIQQEIAGAYSFFMEMYLKHPQVNVATNAIDRETFEKEFIRKVLFDKVDPEHIVMKCLMAIYNRNHHFDTYFDPYCFDAQMSPNIIYHSLYLTTLPEAHYKWKIDGLRYHLLEQSYFRIGGFIVDDFIEKKGGIPSNQAKDKDDNVELAKKRQGLIRVLTHLGMEFYFDKKNNTKIEIDKVISSLQTFAFNRLVRYERKIKEYKDETNKWEDAFKKYFISEKGDTYVPFVYLSKQEYKSLNRKGIKESNDDDSDKILQLFQYTSSSKEFNRFRTEYNIYLQPFLDLGNYLFSPIVFFTSFTGIYVYVDTLLKNNSREKDTIIEDRLAELLENSKWNIKQIKEQDVGKIDGDADLILYDDDTVVFMQLKRTNLRLNTKEAYYNRIDVDVKAAKQLNNVENFFSETNEFFNIENRKVHKWIVSTSLEDLQTNIDGCLKLNYFDFFLLYSEIFDSESKDFESLDDFINYFGRDSVFVNILGEYPQLANQRSIDEMSKYHFPFHEFNKEKVSTYKDLYDEGIELNKLGKNYESIAIFQKCLDLEDEDVEVHSAIANVYADIRDYRNAFYHFRKALSLLPNDPFIMTNFIVVLLESGNFFTAIILDYLFKKYYPLVIDTRQKQI